MASPNRPPAWHRAFLRALSKTASVKLAAESVGICRTTAYPLRRKNPKFAELWDQALADGRAAIASGKVPGLLSVTHREKLTVRGSKTGRICIAKAGHDKMDAEKEAIFLEHLAATANVKLAAAAINMSTAALYKRRMLWPAFREAWDEAKAFAVDRLDFMLIEAATNMLDPPEVPCPDPMPVSFDQALRLVQHAQATNRRGEAKRHGWRRKPVDVEALKAEILRKIAVIDAAGEGRFDTGFGGTEA